MNKISRNHRLIQAIEKAGSAQALAEAIEESPRTLQYQARRGYFSPSIARKVGSHYSWPSQYVLDMLSWENMGAQ
jgi:hypothetical protein